MASIIWTDEPEGSIFENLPLFVRGQIVNKHDIRSPPACKCRHIIAKGNVLEGRKGL